MALDLKQFIHKVDVGIVATKDYKRFYITVKVEGKLKKTLVDYTDKATWNKKDRILNAKLEREKIRNKMKDNESNLGESTKLDKFAELHFNGLPDTSWTLTKRRHYDNYLKKSLGNKKVTELKQMHIKQCIQAQEKLGLSARTVKTTLEILNPMLDEAVANRLIDFNPCSSIKVSRPKTNKLVVHPTEELIETYNAIYEIFKNDPKYLSFYLFALQTRRKSEILTLKWENINFNDNLYMLVDTKNGEHQMMTLPSFIKVELEKFKQASGWVYSSTRSKSGRIVNVEKQTKKIKERVPTFTLHRLRNVVVSAMASQGKSATLMSGALGHNNTNTLAKYLTLDYQKGSEEVADTILNLVSPTIISEE